MGSAGLGGVDGGPGVVGWHLGRGLLARGRAGGDLASFEVARRATEGAEFVFHQAAIPSVPRSVAEPIGSHESGPTATLNVLEASRRAGVRRVMFAASSSAYGDAEELPKH